MSEVIRFNYLYRDSGNWKKFGNKMFSNPEQLTSEEIILKLHRNRIDQTYFYPDQVGIKKFKFHRNLDDDSWYEFESVETLDNSDLILEEMESINNFLGLLKNERF